MYYAEMGISMNQMFIKAVEEYIEKNYKAESGSETAWEIGIYRRYTYEYKNGTKIQYWYCERYNPYNN